MSCLPRAEQQGKRPGDEQGKLARPHPRAARPLQGDGFERINPSILKADIQASFPGFSEKALGFKRFSDMLKAMEKEGLITVELDDQKNMLIKVS